MKKFSRFQKKIGLTILFFIIIRIPIALLDLNLWIVNDFIEGLKNGHLIYCETKKYPSASYFLEKNYPPGLYIYLLMMNLFFYNFFLIFLELSNAFLIFKIVKDKFGKKSAINCLAFITFFPLSILNSGFMIDPIQISLFMILSSYLLFRYERTILSAFLLSFGTIIIYIPAAMLIPITIYYLKNGKFLETTQYLFIFILGLIGFILPFLILCPEKFFFIILKSLNEPQTQNFLENPEFFLNDLLDYNLIHIRVYLIHIDFKILNLLQIGTLIIIICYFWKKFKFENSDDIIISTIILILTIKLITLYMHYRFIYWAIMLSLIIMANKNEQEIEHKNILIFGLIYCFFTFSVFILSKIDLKDYFLIIYSIQLFILLVLINLIFVFFSINFSNLERTRKNFLKKLILYSSILIFLSSFYDLLINITFNYPIIFDFSLFLLFSLDLGIILIFIICGLYRSYKVTQI